jgi:hypothetical protein
MYRQYRPEDREFNQLYQQLTFYKSDVIFNTQIAVLDLRPYMDELNKITDMYKRDDYIDLIANVVSFKVFNYIHDEVLKDRSALVTVVVSSHISSQSDEKSVMSAKLSNKSDINDYKNIILTVYLRLKHNKQSKYNKIVLLFNYFC